MKKLDDAKKMVNDGTSWWICCVNMHKTAVYICTTWLRLDVILPYNMHKMVNNFHQVSDLKIETLELYFIFLVSSKLKYMFSSRFENWIQKIVQGVFSIIFVN